MRLSYFNLFLHDRKIGRVTELRIRIEGSNQYRTLIWFAEGWGGSGLRNYRIIKRTGKNLDTISWGGAGEQIHGRICGPSSATISYFSDPFGIYLDVISEG